MKSDRFEKYDVLAGFNFVGEADRVNALLACVWAGQVMATGWERREAGFRPPLVVIVGPPGCGKTRLAARLMSLACESVRFEGRFDEASLARAASAGRPVLVFDDVQAAEVDRALLERWLTAPFWKVRRLREEEELTTMLNVLTVLTAPSLALPKEIEEMAVVIRLKD